MHRAFYQVQHVVERQRQVPYFVVPFAGRNPATQVRLPDPGCGFSDLANMVQHSSGHEEDNCGTEQHDKQPKAEKTETKIFKYTEFISFRNTELDMSPIIE